MKRADVWVAVALGAVLGTTLYPSFVRARGSAGAAQAIGDTRRVIEANQTYASANCGLFAEDLVCMTREHGPICIPDYPKHAPEFISADLGRPSPYVKASYEREYQGFDAPAPEATEPRCAPRSPRVACYASWPTTPEVGARSFVGLMPGDLHEDPFGGDPRCVPIVTSAGTSWGAPENTPDIDSDFVFEAHAAEDRRDYLVSLALCFVPAFAAVFLLSLLKSAFEPKWLLAIFGLVFVNAMVFARALIVFLIPAALATALAPRETLTTLAWWGRMVLAAIAVSILVLYMVEGLVRY